MATRSILRWAGSKKKLLPLLREKVPPHFGRYYEPFAGSACLFFDIAPRSAVLGDFNEDVIHLFRIIKWAHRKLSAILNTMPMDASYYYKVRAQDPRTLSAINRAARFLYLNRFCFNGVYRTNRSGQFNVPRGNDTGKLPSDEDIADCARILRNAHCVAGDFAITLSDAGPGDFVYVDPPYAKVGRPGYGEYGYGAFEERDLPRLIERLHQLHEQGTYVLLSYSTDPTLLDELAGWDIQSVSVRRHVSGFAGARGIVREYLLSNINLIG